VAKAYALRDQKSLCKEDIDSVIKRLDSIHPSKDEPKPTRSPTSVREPVTSQGEVGGSNSSSSQNQQARSREERESPDGICRLCAARIERSQLQSHSISNSEVDPRPSGSSNSRLAISGI